MIEWMTYLLQSAMAFAILLLPFFILKGDTRHKRNRYYLLTIPLVAAILPLININTTVAQTETGLEGWLQTISVTPQNVSAQLTQWSASEMIGMGVVLVSVILLTIRIYQGYCLYRIIRTHKQHSKDNVIAVPGEKTCFSVMGYIFLSADMRHPHIINHEWVHIKQKHTIDLFFYNLYTAVYWFSPFAWLALKSIKAQHEYEADKIIIQSTGNKNEYQALLLSSALGCEVHALTHSFSSPTLKNRFRMMTKKQSSKWTGLKTLAVVPFAALAVAAFSISCNTAEKQDVAPNKQEGKTPNDGEMIMPEYPGGMEAMASFLSSNLVYPESAKKDSVEGKVFVEFMVKNDGAIENVTIKKGLRTDCDEEAMRVIKLMPKWKPATKNGKPANATLTLPIHFKLN